MHKQQIVKELFPTASVKDRDIILKKIDKASKDLNIPFEDVIKKFKKKETANREKYLPDVLEQIINVSYIIETNEKLEDGYFSSFVDKSVAKHAKPMVNSLMKVYEKEYNDLYKTQDLEMRTIMQQRDTAVNLLRRCNKDGFKELLEVLNAWDADPKSIIGVARKVNKYNKK